MTTVREVMAIKSDLLNVKGVKKVDIKHIIYKDKPTETVLLVYHCLEREDNYLDEYHNFTFCRDTSDFDDIFTQTVETMKITGADRAEILRIN